MERHQNGQVFLAHHALENAQKLQLIADVEIACRLVKDDQLRLLTKRAGKQDPLPLAVADGLKGLVGKVQRVDLAKTVFYDFFVLLAQNAEPSGVRVPAGADNVAAGHEFRVHAGGHDDRHALCGIPPAARAQILAVQKHCALDGGQLRDDGFKNRRFSRAVRADERDNFAALYRERNIPDEGLCVIADAEAGRFQVLVHLHAAFLWIIM